MRPLITLLFDTMNLKRFFSAAAIALSLTSANAANQLETFGPVDGVSTAQRHDQQIAVYINGLCIKRNTANPEACALGISHMYGRLVDKNTPVGLMPIQQGPATKAKDPIRMQHAEEVTKLIMQGACRKYLSDPAGMKVCSNAAGDLYLLLVDIDSPPQMLPLNVTN